MSKMYVANLTNQNQDFMYTLPERRGGPIRVVIPIGQQIPLPGDLTTKDIESIIEQHSRYGLVSMIEIDSRKPFCGVCYNLDRPIPVARMRAGMEHNFSILNTRGEKLRSEAAVAVSQTIEASLPQELRARLETLDMEVIEEGDNAEMAEGTRVSRNPEATIPRNARKRKAA